jgi:hypothetical protein
MNLCSEEHDEVCFESPECPMCLLIKEIKDLEDEVSVLEAEIENLDAGL